MGSHDVISARVSDHQPVIHDGVLFWNVMMQGKTRGEDGYNNGFGIVERDENYIQRLDKVAQVIAEIVLQHPGIEAIGLCEAPVQSMHVAAFLKSLKKYSWMRRFIPQQGTDWGLLALFDKRYEVNTILYEPLPEKLANRFQLWQLKSNGKTKYLALAHFPFGGDVHTMEKENLSTYGKYYSQMVRNVLREYTNEHLIFCADFNFNPYLISEWKDRSMDRIANNNSILFAKKSKPSVTVDGILLSLREKQKYHSLRFDAGLSVILQLENNLLESSIRMHMENQSSQLQRAHDRRFGLMPY